MKWLDRKKETSDEQVKMTIPWFILVFVMAVAVHGFLPKDIPLFNTVYEWSNLAGKSLLKVAILLTGLQLSRAVVKKVGLPSMTHALILWVVMSSVTLSWILYAA